MKNKIIIEFTWLPWSGKTTLTAKLSENPLYKNNVFFINNYMEDSLNKQNFYKKIITRIRFIFSNKNIFINHFILFIKWLFHWNFKILFTYSAQSFHLSNIKKQKNDFLIADEIYLHRYFWSILHSGKKVNKNLLDYLLKISDTNIYPIFIHSNNTISLERIKQREINNSLSFDKYSDKQKLSLLEKNWNLSEYITRKYCEIHNKPFLEISTHTSIPEKYEQICQHIDDILKISS